MSYRSKDVVNASRHDLFFQKIFMQKIIFWGRKKFFGEISSKKIFLRKFPQKKIFCFWKKVPPKKIFFWGRKKFSGEISSKKNFFSPQTYFFILYRSVIPWTKECKYVFGYIYFKNQNFTVLFRFLLALPFCFSYTFYYFSILFIF